MDDDPVDLKVESGRFDLEGFVRNGDWREMLSELVEKRRLDPWDIDIASIVDGYVGAVRQMKVLELSIPANIILATAILLRMKSDTVSFFGPDGLEQDLGLAAPEEFVRVIPDVSGLVYKSRLRPARRITLEELMGALEEAMKIEVKHLQIHDLPLALPIRIDSVGIDQKVERVINIMGRYLDRYRSTTFSTLTREFAAGNMLTELFIPLLFLANKGRVGLAQEDFFGEILIVLREGG